MRMQMHMRMRHVHHVPWSSGIKYDEEKDATGIAAASAARPEPDAAPSEQCGGGIDQVIRASAEVDRVLSPAAPSTSTM